MANNAFFGLGVLERFFRLREATAKEVMQRFQKESSVLPGLQVYTFSPPDLPGTPQGLPFQMVLKTLTGLQRHLYQYAEKLKEYAQKSGKFILRAERT